MQNVVSAGQTIRTSDAIGSLIEDISALLIERKDSETIWVPFDRDNDARSVIESVIGIGSTCACPRPEALKAAR